MTEQDIIAKAIALSDDAERTAFLSRACAGDPDLLRRVVQQVDRQTRRAASEAESIE